MARTIIFGLLLLMLTALATAALEITEPQVTIDADYGRFTDDDQQTITATTSTITIKNTDATGNKTVTIDALFTPNGYSLVETKTEIIPANSSKQVALSIKIPHKLAPGNETVGTIRIRDASGVEKPIPLVQNTLSLINFEDVEIDYTDDENNDKSKSFDENDDEFDLSDNVLVGTEVTFTFSIENLFDNDYDEDFRTLEDVTLTIEVDDDDIYDTNIDEEIDLGDLDGREKKNIPLTFTISDEADAGEYEFDLTLEGEDGKHLKHKLERTLRLDVTRKRNDVRLVKAQLVPASITLCDKDFAVDIELKNYGTRDHKHVALAVYNTELGINENIAGIKLAEYDDDDNSWRKHFSYQPVVKKKTYRIDVKAYVDDDEEIDSEGLDLEVKACLVPATAVGDTTADVDLDEEESATADAQQKNVSVPTAGTPGTSSPIATTTPQPVSRSSIVQSIEQSYTVEELIIGGMAVVVVLLVALIGLFVTLLLRRK